MTAEKDEPDAPGYQEEVAPADPYGMFQRRRIAMRWNLTATADPNGGIETRENGVPLEAISEMLAEPGNDEAEVAQLFTDVERDLMQYWLSKDLPPKVSRYWRVGSGPWCSQPPPCDDIHQAEACRHPAERAEAGTFLARSWEVWRLLEETRRAPAEGRMHRFGLLLYALGRVQVEVKAALQHGRSFQVGHNTIGGGTRAAEQRFADDRPMHEAWIRRDRELQAAGMSSQRKRAATIATEMFGQEPETVRTYLKRHEKKNQEK